MQALEDDADVEKFAANEEEEEEEEISLGTMQKDVMHVVNMSAEQRPPCDGQQFVFRIVEAAKSKYVEVAASSQADMEGWITAIQQAIRGMAARCVGVNVGER